MDKQTKPITDNDKIEGLTQPISKSQLKKMRRKEEWDKKKKDIRKAKKDKQKEKKRKLKEENPELYEQQKKKHQVHVPFNNDTNTHQTRKEREEEYKKKVSNGIKIIIDCDFEDLMNEKSIISMCRQIADCYCINKRSLNPFNLILYNVGTALYDQLGKNHCDNWIGITICKKGAFVSFQSFAQSSGIFPPETKIDYKINTYYLTADSPNEINQLENQKAYIIGGIVDRNRYKMLSFNKANELGINHGKLPIGEYLKLNSSKVLTTNHVFAILSHFNDNKDWKEAFMTIIPKRKIEDNDKGNGEEIDEKEEDIQDLNDDK